MSTDNWIHLIEVLVLPVILLFIRKLTADNKSSSAKLYDKLDEFRVENTNGLVNLADKIERTLERHSDKLDNHNGRISAIEGKIDTPSKRHRRYDDS